MAPPDGFDAAVSGGVESRLAPVRPAGLPAARTEYRVSCPPSFRAAVLRLCLRRHATVSSLIELVFALVDPAVRAAVADPGAGYENGASPAKLTAWLTAGYSHGALRQALAVALALGGGASGWRLVPDEQAARLAEACDRLEQRAGLLASALARLAFRPLDGGPQTLAEAARIMGFGDPHELDERAVARRFRELAPVYHPDTGALPCRERLSQLIDARGLLVRHLRQSE
ncbi:MAG: hypothetical protein GC191_17290 [Azospirillum sp.]|nr:hypothetical protein [Azospirillum sp.]